MLKTLATALIVGVAASAAAQETATIVQRDGTRTTGRFEAWNRNTDVLYLRLSLADQRKIPLRDAAVIAVGDDAGTLPKDELARAAGDDHLLVLRNGTSHLGRLTNIEGGEGSGQEDAKRILSFKTSGGDEVRVPFADVRRLYLGNVSSGPTLAEPDAPADGVKVPADAGWVDTGISVARGDSVMFDVTGQVQISPNAADRAQSAGLPSARLDTDSLAPKLPIGALIGRVGDGLPFGIGNQTTPLPMPDSGRLFLAVNDDQHADNHGAFAVTIRVIRSR